jgi:hypothetical protein
MRPCSLPLPCNIFVELSPSRALIVPMSSLLDRTVSSTSSSLSTETFSVSAGDIDFVERQLKLIDLKNSVLSCVSKWFSCWAQTRNLFLGFAAVSFQEQESLAPSLKKLSQSLSNMGKELAQMAVLDVLSIQDAHFKIATGYALSDLGACIAFLDDRIEEFFTPIPSEIASLNFLGEECDGTDSVG